MINPLVPAPGASLPPVSPTGTQPAQSIAAIRLLREGSRPLIEVSVLPARVPSLIVGEEVEARIAERLDDHRVVALIKGNAFTLDLPVSLSPQGDTLTLKVAQLNPKLTFLLLAEADHGGAHADSSTSVQLSRSAQYLNTLLDVAKLETAPQAERAASAAPVLSPTPAEPETLAEGLKQAVAKSGVFYESHLKAWAEGRLPLAALKDEPQTRARFAARVETAAEQTVVRGESPADPAASASVSGATRHGGGITPELGQIVQRQLDTLENRQVQLPVFAWPGQAAQLTIQEERLAERDAESADAEARTWHTKLDIDLPSLGGLSVRVSLSGGTVQVGFAADESTSAALIERHAGQLAGSFASAGLNLAQLTVAGHDDAQ